MAQFAAILETVMLVCFGISWPINLIKNYKVRSAKGMSLPFILMIEGGYVAGIAAKIIKIDTTPLYLLIVYIINFITVGGNIWVYFRNRRLDQENGK